MICIGCFCKGYASLQMDFLGKFSYTSNLCDWQYTSHIWESTHPPQKKPAENSLMQTVVAQTPISDGQSCLIGRESLLRGQFARTALQKSFVQTLFIAGGVFFGVNFLPFNFVRNSGALGTAPILRKTLREFGLNFRRPTCNTVGEQSLH